MSILKLLTVTYPVSGRQGCGTSGGGMKKFWKVAAIVALAAIPLIIIGKKKPVDIRYIPESGDESDIFDRELRAD